MIKPAFWDEATAALSRKDRTMKRLIQTYPDIHLRKRQDAFTTLARAITGQQLSVKAANSIWNRLVDAVAASPRSRKFPRLDPAAIAVLETEKLRSCGFSAGKASYLRDLASHFESGRLNP